MSSDDSKELDKCKILLILLRECMFAAPEDHPVHPKLCDTAARKIEQLAADLDIEKRNHASVIDAFNGRRHAWFCTIQLAGGKCNCPMRLVRKIEVMESLWAKVKDMVDKQVVPANTP